MNLNSVLLRATGVAALGGLLFGFDTAVISGTTGALSQVFDLSSKSLGITVSIAIWGTVVGAMLAGFPGERYGRRDSLRGLALFYLISALGCAFAWNWWSLVAFRFIGGLGIGGSSVLGPMYIAEIAPAEWRWDLGVAAFPAALFFLLLFAIPRSPRWLVKQGRVAEARTVLQMTGDDNYERDLQDIVESIDVEQKRAAERLFSRKYAFPIFLAVSIGMFNQLSGINAILYYLNDIFAHAGFSRISGNLQAVAIGATNLLFTMIAMTVIDRLGRKKLLLVGSVGTAACLAGVSAIFFTHSHESLLVWLLVGYIAFFAFSQGAVIWVYISEVFPNAVRAKGQSLGSFSHWFMNALISGIFPLMAASSGAYPFVFFSVMMAVQFFVVLLVYPETKGFTLEEMQKELATT